MSEHIPAFIAALYACEEYGYTIKMKGTEGYPNQRFFIHKTGVSNHLGVIPFLVLQKLEAPKTKRVLAAAFRGIQNLPDPIVDWISAMPLWGAGIHDEVRKARADHGIKLAAGTVTRLTRGDQRVEPSEEIQIAARQGASQRQMRGAGFCNTAQLGSKPQAK